jgi:hypothetical protein
MAPVGLPSVPISGVRRLFQQYQEKRMSKIARRRRKLLVKPSELQTRLG